MCPGPAYFPVPWWGTLKVGNILIPTYNGLSRAEMEKVQDYSASHRPWHRFGVLLDILAGYWVQLVLASEFACDASELRPSRFLLLFGPAEPLFFDKKYKQHNTYLPSSKHSLSNDY